MARYISILRGINVGGQKKIGMAGLREMYLQLGFEDAETYIQSGNVVFSHPGAKTAELAAIISSAIEETFGYSVPVIVLERDELHTVIRNNPFTGDPGKQPSFMHVTFLSSLPDSPDLEKIRQKQGRGEEFVLAGRAVYLYCPNGYGKSRLSNTAFENILKVTATTRNWKTTNELLSMAEKRADQDLAGSAGIR